MSCTFVNSDDLEGDLLRRPDNRRPDPAAPGRGSRAFLGKEVSDSA